MTDPTHKKFFQVAKMPWHDDDHKFGESEAEMTWNDVAKKFIPIFEEMEEDFKQLAPPGFVTSLPKYPVWEPAPVDFAMSISTVCLVDSGKCYYCQDKAVYAFRSRLYCATCWLELSEDDD